MFERGTPSNTFSIFPTRQFMFIADPDCVERLDESHGGTVDLIGDLRSTDCPIRIDLIIPKYLASGPTRLSARLQAVCIQVDEPTGAPDFEPDPSIQEAALARLTESSPEAARARALLALALEAQADGVVTNSPPLLEARYPVYQHHQVRVIPLEEFSDVIDVCAHGHSIFWSATHPDRMLTLDAYYPMAHWKASRLYTWYRSKESTIESADLKQSVHSLLLVSCV